MSAEPPYHRDPAVRRAETRVLRSGEDAGGAYVVLEDDIFYPEGGGQPPDGGTVGDTAVVDVQKVGDEVRVYLDGPAEPGQVTAVLDWERRLDHMQQHTGQHLLTAVAEDAFGWATTAFHLGERYSAVELDTPRVPDERLEALERRVNEAIREVRPVRPRLVDQDEYETLAVRSRGLPEGYRGPVRLVEIEGVDLNTCGGTHCASTADLQVLRLVGTEPMRGGTRLSFLVGGRVLREAHRAAEVEREVKERLGCAPEEFARVLDRRAAEARGFRRRAESAEAELASLVGRELAAGVARAAVHAARGRDAGFLRGVADAYLDARPSGLVVVLGSDDAASFFLVAGDETAADEVGRIGAVVAASLGGRGGGRGGRFQGKGPDPERLDAAARAASEALGLV